MDFKTLLYIFFSLIFSLQIVTAKKSNFREIEAIDADKTDIFNFDINIKRTQFDKKIDEIIFDRLGEEYRRANVYDFYPMQVKESMSTKDKIAMMDYYNYARKELEYINQSQLIRVIEKDLNLDGKMDYAVLVRNIKKDKNYLAILDLKNTHYLEFFQEDFLELINFGSFPTQVITQNNKTQTINSPVLKLVSFEEKKSKALYYDRTKEKWKDIEVSL